MGADETKDDNDPSKNKNATTKNQNESNFVRLITTSRTYNVLSIIVAIISILTIVTITVNECTQCFSKLHQTTAAPPPQPPTKTYRVFHHNLDTIHLQNILTVLDRVGYQSSPNHSTDWDLLWAHDYPFRVLSSEMHHLLPHQKVNHFPGSGFITNKVDLATSGLKYIPPAFKLPGEKGGLLEYAERNANRSFVEKDNNHRRIKIRRLEEVDLDAEGSFVQEFVDRPLLVSGYKFDVGIYVVVTSVDPLRVYIYNGEALLRFCPVKYHPFDPNNIDKYVVGDDYLPTWQVPALDYYYNTLGFGMRDSLNAYLRSKNKDPSVIWEQIEDSIRIVMLAREPKIVEAVGRYPSKDNFFEMMRFDYVVDEDLKVYLMEANMSPNLSSAHFPKNKLLFQQVIYNMFGLVGIAERIYKDTLAVRSQDEEEMQTADKNLMVFPTQCNSVLCRTDCVSPICQLCRPCLTTETKTNLIRAHREHMNRGDCKRVFPSKIKPEPVPNLEDYSPENQLQIRWFQGKCQLDASWC